MSLLNIRRLFIYFFLVVFVVNASLVVWLAVLSAQSPHIVLTPSGITETPSLCPGDPFPYAFTVQVDRASTIELSYTVMSATAIGGTDIVLEQFIFDVPGTITVRRGWVVPDRFSDIMLGDVPWKSGTYLRRIQARATGDRRISDELVLPFEISEDCFK